MSTPPDNSETQQTSFRFDKRLFGQFKNKLIERDAKMAPTLEALMRIYVEDPSIIDAASSQEIDPSRPVDMHRAFVRWVPAVVLVKSLEGHVVYANEGFLDLVGQEDVIGLRAHDYLEKATADQISRHDDRVRKERLPLLCAEHISI